MEYSSNIYRRNTHRWAPHRRAQSTWRPAQGQTRYTVQWRWGVETSCWRCPCWSVRMAGWRRKLGNRRRSQRCEHSCRPWERVQWSGGGGWGRTAWGWPTWGCPWRGWWTPDDRPGCQTGRQQGRPETHTVQRHYNLVNFLQNIHEGHPIARPSGRGMGCLLWVQPLINIQPQFLQWCVQYLVISYCVVTALNCT